MSKVDTSRGRWDDELDDEYRWNTSWSEVRRFVFALLDERDELKRQLGEQKSHRRNDALLFDEGLSG